ncbi:MAG: FHA domain-containing protein [Planctomycetales bacterium]
MNLSPSAAASDKSSASPIAAPLLLEIERGRTRFPLRPVRSGRFLIGSGGNCDLRLGGHMPLLHSIVLVEAGEVTLEAVAPVPPLKVNGCEVETARLRDGDRIELGSFEIVVRRPEFDIAPQTTATAEAEKIDEARLKGPAEMSAAELVAELEREEALVEEFDEGIRQGAAALLQAALARPRGVPEVRLADPERQARPFPGRRPASEGRILNEVERTLSRLDDFARGLEERSRRLSRREAGYAEAAAVLLETQSKLAEQVEALCRKVASLEAKHDQGPTRAIA